MLTHAHITIDLFCWILKFSSLGVVCDWWMYFRRNDYYLFAQLSKCSICLNWLDSRNSHYMNYFRKKISTSAASRSIQLDTSGMPENEMKLKFFNYNKMSKWCIQANLFWKDGLNCKCRNQVALDMYFEKKTIFCWRRLHDFSTESVACIFMMFLLLQIAIEVVNWKYFNSSQCKTFLVCQPYASSKLGHWPPKLVSVTILYYICIKISFTRCKHIKLLALSREGLAVFFSNDFIPFHVTECKIVRTKNAIRKNDSRSSSALDNRNLFEWRWRHVQDVSSDEWIAWALTDVKWKWEL